MKPSCCTPKTENVTYRLYLNNTNETEKIEDMTKRLISDTVTKEGITEKVTFV